MRLRRHLVRTLAFLAVLVAAAPAGAAATGTLLRKHEPILVFHPGEEFRPIPVEGFVRDSQLEAATGPASWILVDASPSADALPGTSPPVWRLNQRGCFAGAPALGDLACYAAADGSRPDRAVYGRVARTGGTTVLQYWLFYYDNLYRYPFLPTGAIWQSHEGDWEQITVVLDRARKPVEVGLSRHCAGEARPWDAVRHVKRHPVVYVALGSHAHYFAPGTHPFDPACLPPQVTAFFQQAGLPLPADVAAPGPTGGPRRHADEALPIERIDEGSPSWTAYPGFWGELEYFHAPAPVGTVPFGTSPVGPAFHPAWRDPLGTIAAWRSPMTVSKEE